MISERVKLIRRILNLNQAEFAKLLGVGQTTVSTVENGGNLSTKLANAIANNVEGLRIAWLEKGEDPIFVDTSKYKKAEIIFQQNNKGKDNRQNILDGGRSNEELIKFLKIQNEKLQAQVEHQAEIIKSQSEQLRAKEEQVNQLLNQLFKNN